MFVLRNILSPLQNVFGNSRIGLERGTWFIYTLLAIYSGPNKSDQYIRRKIA